MILFIIGPLLGLIKGVYIRIYKGGDVFMRHLGEQDHQAQETIVTHWLSIDGALEVIFKLRNGL